MHVMNGGNVYEVRSTPDARRRLRKRKRDQDLIKRILSAMEELADNQKLPCHKKLRGEKFDNLYRYRVGDWRILYAIEEGVLIVVILEVVRRDQAYR